MTKNNALERALLALSGMLGVALLSLIPQTAAAQESGWQLDPDARIELGAVSAESTTRDEQLVIDGDAFTLRAQVGLDFEDDDTRFRVEADRIEVFRPEEGRSNSQREFREQLLDS